MFEIFQVIWDLLMMRREARLGRLTWRRGIISFALVLLGYLILVPAVVVYDKHPELKPLLIAAVVLAAGDYIFLLGLALYWWRQGPVRNA
jgi:hypothetical protein